MPCITYHGFEELVEGLNDIVDEPVVNLLVLLVRHFPRDYLLVCIEPDDEVETRVSPVDYFVAFVLHEGARVRPSPKALPHELSLQGDSLFGRDVEVILGQSRLPLFVDHENEVDHLDFLSNRIAILT